MKLEKRTLAVSAAIIALVVMAPVSAIANTTGDVSFDLDPTNVPTCASSLTVPNRAVEASVVDTDYWTTNASFSDSTTASDIPVYSSYFMSDEFTIEWHVNNCWGPNYGGLLEEDGVIVTKTTIANSVSSQLPTSIQGSNSAANANQVWLGENFSAVKLGSDNQWTDLYDLGPNGSTQPVSDNTYTMRLELALQGNYETYLSDSTFTAVANYDLWED